MSRAASSQPEFPGAQLNDAEHIYVSAFGGLRVERDGSSLHRPVLISANSAHIGVPMEYAYLQGQFGHMGTDWTVDLRCLATNFHGRTVETFRLTLTDGTKVDFHFDVTLFFQD